MILYQNSIYSMGTRFNMVLPGLETPEGDSIFCQVVQELEHLEQLMSCFLSESEVSRVNANASARAVRVDPELFSILQVCEAYRVLSGGVFNATLGALIDYWMPDTLGGNWKHPVSASEMGNMILDPVNQTVFFESGQLKINLGAYGKGYALDKVTAILRTQGIKTAYVSFGESSIACLGRHPYGNFWPVGIQDPFQQDTILKTHKVLDAAVSTSSTFEAGNPIVHPKTGCPVEERKMVSVKAHTAAEAEALSTIFLLAEKVITQEILSSRKGVEAVFVRNEDVVSSSI